MSILYADVFDLHFDYLFGFLPNLTFSYVVLVCTTYVISKPVMLFFFSQGFEYPLSSNTSSSPNFILRFSLPRNYFTNYILSSLVILVLFFLSWRGYSSILFFGHLLLNLNSIYFIGFSVILFCMATILFFSTATTELFVIPTLIILYMRLILILFLSLIFSTTNLYSSVVVVEFLTSILFLIVVLSTFSGESKPGTFNLPRIITSLLSFFWVNTLVSACLFLLLLYIKTVWLFWDYHLIFYRGTVIYSNWVLNLSIFLFLVLIIFLKCGLPPMLIWKCLMFSTTPLSFVGFYIINYYFFIFIFILKLFTIYLLQVGFFNFGGWELINLIMLISVSLMLISSVWFFNYPEWGVFFAVSSLLTTSFLFLIYLISVSDCRSVFEFNYVLISYLLLYVSTNFIFFYLLNCLNYWNFSREAGFNSNDITSTLLCLGRWNLMRALVFTVFASLASLPPTTQFLIKLFLIARLQSFNLYIFSFVLCMYLFYMLIFYFRNSKTVLADYVTTRTNFSNSWLNSRFERLFFNSALRCSVKREFLEYPFLLILILGHFVTLSIGFTGEVLTLNWVIFY